MSPTVLPYYFRPSVVAAAIMVMSCLVLVLRVGGWYFPIVNDMKTATAVLSILFSTFILVYPAICQRGYQKWATAFFAVVALSLAAQLVGHVFQVSNDVFYLGSPASIVAFLLISSAALIVLVGGARYVRLMQVLLVVSGSIGYLGILGHAYWVPEFTGVKSALLSLPGAFVICGFSYCLLMLQPERGFLEPFQTRFEGGRQGRFFFPVVLFVPFCIGYIRLFGHWYAWFSTEFGVALIIGTTTTIFIGVLYQSMKIANKRDKTRLEAEHLLASSNEQLKALTKKLTTVTAELQAANEEYLALNEELQAANEEMNSNNEELSALNDQLNDANKKIHEQATFIVEQKHKELTLSEGSLRAILDSTDHAYSFLNPDNTIRAFNKANFDEAVRNTGKELVVGANIFDYISEGNHEAFQATLNRVRQGAKVSYEREYPRANGSQWLSVTVSPVYSADQQFIGYCFASVDQTALRMSQIKLNEERNLLRVIIDHLPLNVYVKDRRSRKTLANKAEYEYLGFTREEDVIGKSDHDLYPEKSSRVSLLEDATVISTGVPIINRETVNTKKDGTTRSFLISKIPLRNARQEVVGLVGLSFDITPRIKSEARLKKSNERFTLLSKATNDAVFDWDLVSGRSVWNHAVETIFGYPISDAETQSDEWVGRVHPEDRLRVKRDLISQFARKNTVWIGRFRFRCSDGSFKHVLNRAFIIYEDGHAVRMIGALQDVTEVTRYREGLEQLVADRTRELNDALKAEKEMVELKSRFISIASHEFRTPLTTIGLTTGYIKRYQDRLQAGEFEKKLAVIEKQVSHMTYLLDDVLLIGRAEAGKLEVNLAAVDLATLVNSIVDEVQLGSLGTHLLSVHWSATPGKIETDEKLFHNILANLLTNAIKFSTRANRVELTISFLPTALCLSVKDHGVGIPAQDLPSLFEPFHRGSNVSEIQGTGLGLSIVKRSAELLGGTIAVSSTLGEGSEFTVTLPFNHTSIP